MALCLWKIAYNCKQKIPHPCYNDCQKQFLANAPHVIKNLKAAHVNGQEISSPDWATKQNALTSNVVSTSHLQSLLECQENVQLKGSQSLTSKTLASNHFDKMGAKRYELCQSVQKCGLAIPCSFSLIQFTFIDNSVVFENYEQVVRLRTIKAPCNCA